MDKYKEAYLIIEDGSIEPLYFDLTSSEKHDIVSTVTIHPIENGSNIADHIRTEPEQINLEVFITNTPIEQIKRSSKVSKDIIITNSLQSFGSIKGIIENLNRTKTYTISGLGFPEPFNRIKEVHETLLGIMNKGLTVSVVSWLKTYENMAIINVGIPITEIGGATFSIAFQNIKTVSTNTVAAPKPAEPRGQGLKNKGSQSTKKAGKDAEEANDSILLKGFNKVTGLF